MLWRLRNFLKLGSRMPTKSLFWDCTHFRERNCWRNLGSPPCRGNLECIKDFSGIQIVNLGEDENSLWDMVSASVNGNLYWLVGVHSISTRGGEFSQELLWEGFAIRLGRIFRDTRDSWSSWYSWLIGFPFELGFEWVECLLNWEPVGWVPPLWLEDLWKIRTTHIYWGCWPWSIKKTK